MSHKCLRCNTVYADNDDKILRGCSCGSVFFMYIRTPKDVKEFEKIEKELASKETTLVAELEKQLADVKQEVVKEDHSIETVKIPKAGVYEINIDALMKKEPLIILKQGRTYLVHLPSIFEKVKDR